MSKTSLANLFGYTLFFCIPALGHAEIHGTLTLTTDNVGRWYTKNNNSIAAQGNIDYKHSSGFFLGGLASNVDYSNAKFPESAQVEIIPYFGWHFKLPHKLGLDAQWSRYIYDDTLFGHDADYNEYSLVLNYKGMFTGQVSFADNYYNLGHLVISYELSFQYPVMEHMDFSASFGYGQTKDALAADYPYWNIGFTYYYKFMALDLRYMDATEIIYDPTRHTKLEEFFHPLTMDSTAVLSISLGF